MFSKVVETRIFGATTQNSDVRLPIGDSSGGTFTSRANPLRGTLFWDDIMFVLRKVAVAGGATGGSYTITVETDAIAGYTGLPIARATGVGPNSPVTVVMDNLHKSKAGPLPTHLFIDQTATGGGFTGELWVIAKQYRGTFGTPGAKTAERILQGNLFRGNSADRKFGDDKGVSADTTFTIGTSANDLGSSRIRLWDAANFWFVAAGNTLSGTHDMNIIARIGGATVTVATTGVGGALSAAGQKVAIANNFYGQCPNPSHVIWDVVSAGGVSDGRVVGIMKTGRGSLAKS